jgi:methylmalonyl-CoA mutase C-terminal domain/subunit
LAKRESEDIIVFGGGVIPDADLAFLKEAGVQMIFTPGTPLDEITTWVDDNIPGRV